MLNFERLKCLLCKYTIPKNFIGQITKFAAFKISMPQNSLTFY
jgi:hypothetical protein